MVFGAESACGKQKHALSMPLKLRQIFKLARISGTVLGLFMANRASKHKLKLMEIN